MYIAIVDRYTPEELADIVKDSLTMREVIEKLGYKTFNGSNSLTIKKRLEKYNISTDHFKSPRPKARTNEEVFCENSEVRQNTLRKRFKKKSDDSQCQICGQNKIWNGKPLTMIVDHINGNNHDNRIENLRWICPNCGSQLDTFAGRNKKRINEIHNFSQKKSSKRAQRNKICPVCQTNKIYSGSKMCQECRTKEKRKNIPNRETLNNLIKIMPFTKIGIKYGVSDNAVRKWCKNYGLPCTKQEIKNSII